MQPSSLGFHTEGSKLSGSGSFNKVAEVTCKKCQSTFPSVVNLNHHNLKVHKHLISKETKSEETSVTEDCDKCGKVSIDGSQLRAHVLNNHGQKLSCKKCEVEFTTMEKLESHETLYHIKINELQPAEKVAKQNCTIVS